ncbi:invasin domain 3-containing protein [Rufibacter roseus]|uniref:Invasin domain 3-containing protein n=1 Tax=Rufibacter roseus TaxID=1567108 RepID=A0ABW2DH88_9BACT|nr:invasin domain 3-containing protein [Rufibacter roseus]
MKNFYLLPFLLLFSFLSFGQTKGLIYKPASTTAGRAVLDPNGDGYSSQNTLGYQNNDRGESEIDYKAIPILENEPNQDPLRGAGCGFTDMVDSGMGDPVMFYFDGINFLARFRLNKSSPNSKGYSVLIDIDQKFGFTGPNADPNAIAGNPGFEMELVLRTNHGVSLYNIDGTTTPSLIVNKDYEAHTQKSIAFTEECGDFDYFYDFYMPWSDFGLPVDTKLRMVALTVMNPHASTGNNAKSDVGGVDDRKYVGNYDKLFEDFIENYNPTSPRDNNTGINARTLCPSINAPILITSTSITGTSTEAAGTIVTVYKNGTPLENKAIVSASGTWALSVSGLSVGDEITASAKAAGKAESESNCSGVFVGQVCVNPAAPVISGSNGNSNKYVTINVPVAGLLSLYFGDQVMLTNVPVSAGTYYFCPEGGLGDRTNICSGAQNLQAGVYRATITVAGCTSNSAFYCVNVSTESGTPTINSPITTQSRTITGTAAPNAQVILKINGSEKALTTADAAGNWSVPTASLGLTGLELISAFAIENGKCQSPETAQITVAIPVSVAPGITGTYCGTTSIVTGTSSEIAGTIIKLFAGSAIVPIAITTTDAEGKWSVSGLSLAPGTQLTARATAPGKAESNPSVIVQVKAISSNVGFTVNSLTDPATSERYISESATTISGTGPAGSGTVSLYLNEIFIGSGTLAGGVWSVNQENFPNDFRLFAGATLTVTYTAPNGCESAHLPANIEIRCAPPVDKTITPTNLILCPGTIPEVTVKASEPFMIYQLYHETTPISTSRLGTGEDIILKATEPFSSTVPNTLLNLRVVVSKIPYVQGFNCALPLSEQVAVILNPEIVGNTISISGGESLFCGAEQVSPLTGSTPTGGGGNYVYQWQKSSDNITWVDITNAVNKDYTPGLVSTTTYYRRIATDGACTEESASASVQITILPAIINTISYNGQSSFCVYGNPSELQGNTDVSFVRYQWQSSLDGTNFQDIDGAVSANYTPKTLSQTTTYRRLVNNGNCDHYSSTVTITLLPALENNKLTAPATTLLCGPGNVGEILGSTPDGGDNTYTFKWQKSTDNGATFTDILPAVTSKNYTPGAVTSTTYYRRIVSSGPCTDLVSDPVKITVVSLEKSTITTDENTLAADGTSNTIVRVQLKDEFGTDIDTDACTLLIATDKGTVTNAEYAGNGTYTATFTAGTVAGIAQISATLNGRAFTNVAEVTLTPALKLSATTITANPTTLFANGTSTSLATVRFRDYAGNSINVDPTKLVVMLNGVVATATANGIGVFEATVPARTVAEVVEVTAMYDGTEITDKASVEFIAAPNLAVTIVSAIPTTVQADGTSISIARVSFKDYAGNSISVDAAKLTLLEKGVALAGLVDKGNGVYEAVVPARTVAELVEITARYDGTLIDDKATVEFIAIVNLAATQITATPAVVHADGTSTASVKLEFKDYAGNPIAVNSTYVTILLNDVAVTAVLSSPGIYTATVPARTVAETVEVTAKFNGNTLPDKAEVQFIPVVNLAATEISASPTVVNADGSSTSTASIQFKDYANNPISVDIAKVELLLNGASATLTPGGSTGKFTTVVPARTVAEIVEVRGKYDGDLLNGSALVEFIRAVNPLATVISATPARVNADGTSTSTARVTFKDYAGNNIEVASADVTLLLNNTAVTFISIGNGVFEATVPARTVAEVVEVTAKYQNTLVNNNATVEFIPTLNLEATTITANPALVDADGVSTSTATVTFKDYAGNLMNVTASEVKIFLDGAEATVTSAGTGIFEATVPARIVTATVEVTASYSGAPVTDKASVEFVPALNLTATVVSASPATVAADGTSTATARVEFFDYAGNAFGVEASGVQLLAKGAALAGLQETGKGVFEATIPARTVAELVEVTASYNGTAVSDKAEVQFIRTINLSASQVTATPATVNADGESTSTAQVVFRDYAGNPMAIDAANVSLLADGLVLAGLQDKGNGTYEATVPARTVAEVVEITASYNGTLVTDKASVEFVRTVNPLATLVSASPARVNADGTSTATARVQFFDYAGSSMEVAPADVELLLNNTAVTFAPVGNGAFEATVPARTTAEVVEVTAKYQNTLVNSRANVEFVPALNIMATTITAIPTQVNADGVSISTATIVFRDYAGNLINVNASELKLFLDGTEVTATAAGTGTFVATVPARTVAATVEVTASYGGAPVTDKASVEFIPALNLTATVVSANPTTVAADGTSTATARVEFFDYAGNAFGVEASDVQLLAKGAALEGLQERGKGVFEATVPARTVAELVEITATYQNALVNSKAAVEFVPVVNLQTATVTANPERLDADGVSTSTATVTFRDYTGNLLNVDVSEVSIFLDGTAVTVTAAGTGIFEATVPARNVGATVEITASYGGTPVPDKASVEFVPLPVPVLSLQLSTVEASPTIVVADGVSASIITVKLKDTDGKDFITNDPVTISTSFGTIGTVTNNGNGNYTTTLTSTRVGTATITAQVATQELQTKPVVTFVVGSASGATSTIAASEPSIPANGTSTSVITVALFDAQGNEITTGGHTVVLSTTLGTLGAVTDNNNGTYSAVLTSGTIDGVALISGTVNGAPISNTASVVFTPLIPPNRAPVAVNDTYTVNNHEKLTANVLLNDTDPDGDELRVKTTLIRQPLNGSIVIQENGNFTYTPDKGYDGEDSFTYEVCDNGNPALCAQATATIQVKQSLVFIPEGFSPDGDGDNDVFVIYGAEQLRVSLKVFNRWGDIVYENSLYKNDWNGVANKGVVLGNKLPDGTYFYIIDLNNGEKPRAHSLIIKRR